MVYDVVGPNFGIYNNQEVEETPNPDAKNFYELLDAAQKPLWSRCVGYTELSVAVRLLTIKLEGSIPQLSFNQTVELMRETLPPDNLVPEDYYRAKKIVSKLGLTTKKIDYVNGCMLFYTKECKTLKECTFCGAAHYKLKKVGKNIYKNVSVKRMHYLPLISKLKRLYASMSSAPHMR